MILVQTREQFDAAMSVLKEARIIAMDTETNGFHVHLGHRITGISTYCVLPGNEKYAVSFYFPFRHMPDSKQVNLFTMSENIPVEWMAEFAPLLNRDDLTLIFHNAKFDLKMLRADGLWIAPGSVLHMYDTMVMAQMVDENTDHSLKGLAEIHFGVYEREEERKLKALVKKAKGWEKVTPLQMAPYACKDAELTYRLAERLGQFLVDQDLMRLWKREMQFQYVLLEMEWYGIPLDVELAESHARTARNRMRQLENELGFDPGKRDVLARILHGAQPDGLGLWYDPALVSDSVSAEFPQGIPTMDEKALSALEHPICDKVLEYRGLVKANSTWYTGWTQKMSRDQRIHPGYNTAEGKQKYGTVTGRLSSSNPNIQQMPRDDKVGVKKLLKPPPGFVNVEFDYAQIEYREAAIYAEDAELMQQFIDGIDTHQVTADAIGIDRQSAKQAVYTILYGGAGPTLARNMETQVWLNEGKRITVADERGTEILNAYFDLHPNMRAVARRAEHAARQNGYVTLWTGRRRHFIKEEPWTHRKAFNSVLQGGASEIIKESMLRFYSMKDEVAFRMLIQVHDSLWFEMPEDNFDVHCKTVKETMEWPSEIFPIPFPVDFKIIRRHELEAA